MPVNNDPLLSTNEMLIVNKGMPVINTHLPIWTKMTSFQFNVKKKQYTNAIELVNSSTLSANSDYKKIIDNKQKIDEQKIDELSKTTITSKDVNTIATKIVAYATNIETCTINLVNEINTKRIRILKNKENCTKDAIKSIIAIARMALYTANEIIDTANKKNKGLSRYLTFALLHLSEISGKIDHLEETIGSINTREWLYPHGQAVGGKRKTMKRTRVVKSCKRR